MTEAHAQAERDATRVAEENAKLRRALAIARQALEWYAGATKESRAGKALSGIKREMGR